MTRRNNLRKPYSRAYSNFTRLWAGAFIAFIGFAQPLAAEPQNDALDIYQFGLIPPTISKLPANMWTESRARFAADLISETRPTKLPSANRILMRIALAETDSDITVTAARQIFLARLSFLMQAGAVDAAETLLPTENLTDAGLLKKSAEIALLTGRTDALCQEILLGKIDVFITGLEVYCHVQNRDFPSAVDRYDEIADGLSPDRRQALDDFLFVDEIDPASETPWEELPDPLNYRLIEALGRPRAERYLPPSYAYLDIENGASHRMMLEAAETLVKAGGQPNNILFPLYEAKLPAESGGVWGRAESVQNLQAAIIAGDREKASKALKRAEQVFGEVEMLPIFAQGMAQSLALLTIDDFPTKEEKARFVRISLLGGNVDDEWQPHLQYMAPEIQLAYHLRQSPAEEFSYSPNLQQSAAFRAVFSGLYEVSETARAQRANLSNGERIWIAARDTGQRNEANGFANSTAFQELLNFLMHIEAADIAVEFLLSPLDLQLLDPKVEQSFREMRVTENE